MPERPGHARDAARGSLASGCAPDPTKRVVSAVGDPRLTSRATAALRRAALIRRPGRWVGSGELLVALADDADGPVSGALAASGVDVEAAAAGVRGLQQVTLPETDDAVYSPVLTRIRRSAFGYAPVEGPVASVHLLYGLLDERESIAARVLDALGVRRRDILVALARADAALLANDADDAAPPPIGWTETLLLEQPITLVRSLLDAAWSRLAERDDVAVVETADDVTWRRCVPSPVSGLPLVTEEVLDECGTRARVRMSMWLDLSGAGPATALHLGRRARAEVIRVSRDSARRHLEGVRRLLDKVQPARGEAPRSAPDVAHEADEEPAR